MNVSPQWASMSRRFKPWRLWMLTPRAEGTELLRKPCVGGSVVRGGPLIQGWRWASNRTSRHPDWRSGLWAACGEWPVFYKEDTGLTDPRSDRKQPVSLHRPNRLTKLRVAWPKNDIKPSAAVVATVWKMSEPLIGSPGVGGLTLACCLRRGQEVRLPCRSSRGFQEHQSESPA